MTPMEHSRTETKPMSTQSVASSASAAILTPATSIGSSIGSSTLSSSASSPPSGLPSDFALLEELQRFNRQRTPERVMFANGAGAYGALTITADITRFTSARLLQRVGTRTEMFARFSSAGGEHGSPEARRDIRGFALKFYTDDGNWDLVGTNSPVFFIRDPAQFTMLAQALSRNPQTGLRDNAMMWDFFSQRPESLLQITWLNSDAGIPANYRFMNGYGGHTYALTNAKGERFWCKFHFESMQGLRTLDDDDAARLNGEDCDSARRDLHFAIVRKEFPRWRMSMQCMNETQANALPWDPFDVTKLWPIAQFPLLEIGKLELNRNPFDAVAETEHSAFRPSAFVPGIGPSPDKILQARLMSYADAQNYRLGSNSAEISVNKSRCPVMGGLTAMFGASNCGCKHKAAEERAKFTALSQRFEGREDLDNFSQAGEMYRSLEQGHRERLARRIGQSLASARHEVQVLQLAHCFVADEQYGIAVSQQLGLEADGFLSAAHRPTALVGSH